MPFNNPKKKTRKKGFEGWRSSNQRMKVAVLMICRSSKKKDEGSSSVVDLDRKRKHSREEIKKRGNEEAVIGRLEESPPDIVMTKSHSLCVRTVNINYPIVATKNIFFLKLFSNGTKEQRHVIVQIHESGSKKKY